MFKLAHISDIHLGPLPPITTRELMSKRITGYLNWKKNRSRNLEQDIIGALVKHHKTLKLDHTVITGDLINLGLNLEVENVKKWLEKNFSPQETTLVCGNHDAYMRNSLGLALEAWQLWIRGDDKALVSGKENFPTIRRRGNISIISCNSAVATGLFNATGKFLEEQGEKLNQILREEKSKGQCRVVMIHHPPFAKATHNHKRLIGFENFTKAIKEAGAELVLHGHTHLQTINYIEGAEKTVPVVCVSAAYQWIGHKKPSAALNLFEITSNQQKWKISLERHNLQASGAFAPQPKIEL